ncbi:hypothetical protein HK097_007428 [Rhizophlyctis rosea]|uniref:Pectate lyase n=1 Tax=Rhizophlyctis rosea TaxID=64517 RepID=A0AAD5SJK8_9FUNG|nr:hypothetical protein HK097_007428 [Rhizophlyctis rosea]
MKATLIASAALAMAGSAYGAAQTTFPSATSTVVSDKPISVTGTFDGGMKRYNRKSGYCQGQSEGGSADTMFLLQDGATLQNVIIGADQGEGVYCLGSCTVKNVWWEDVCEDALTGRGSGSVTIIGGGARNADDKIFQHNGSGSFSVTDFYAENFGKLYRSCGNCGTQYARKSSFTGVVAVKGKVLVGINPNLGDSTTLSNIRVDSVKDICVKFKGVTSGEPSQVGSGPGGGCNYSESDISSGSSSGGSTKTTTKASTTKASSTKTSTTKASTTTKTSSSGGSGAPLYGQCGGQGWAGPTTCAQGSCKFSNQWYSQCL